MTCKWYSEGTREYPAPLSLFMARDQAGTVPWVTCVIMVETGFLRLGLFHAVQLLPELVKGILN